MTILDRLHWAIDQFNRKSGVGPTTLYLGREEHDEIRRALRLPLTRGHREARPTVYGLELFEVDAQKHLAVA